MKVLFVDDDIDDREFFIDALSYVDTNIQCVLAKDCQHAIHVLEGLAELPEYIFLDIHMPKMNGKTCLAHIKQHEKYRHIRVVMYSTTSDPQLIEEYKTLGATYFLIKPPTFNELCNSLSVLFDK